MYMTPSKDKEIRIPGPDHPITISPAQGNIRVTVAGRTVAESTRALRLDEDGYPPVYYLPREAADMSLLVRTEHYPYCPYKGDCTYYSILPAERNRKMPSGRTKGRMRQSPALKTTWHFIRHEWMQSKRSAENIVHRHFGSEDLVGQRRSDRTNWPTGRGVDRMEVLASDQGLFITGTHCLLMAAS